MSRKPKNQESMSDEDIVPSKAKNLKPLVRVKDDKIRLNQEPEKSKILEEKRKKNVSSAKKSPKRVKTASKKIKTIETIESELKPLAESEVMANAFKRNRPNTRAGTGVPREPKKFLIKKKKRRLKSGFKNSKKWDNRFYLTNGEFVSNDPISQIYHRSKSSKQLQRKGKKDYFAKVDQEIKGLKNMKAARNHKNNTGLLGIDH